MPACNMDGRECLWGLTPWRDCPNPDYCWNVYNNSKCDELCNSEECLFDGRDCREKPSCNPLYDSYCKNNFQNGNCDMGCDNAACNWDGGDCVANKHYVKGTMVIFILMHPDQFRNQSNTFLRNIGQLLEAVVHIKNDDSTGEQMIYPWYPETDTRKKRSTATDSEYQLIG